MMMVVRSSRLILRTVFRKSVAAIGSSWLVGSSRISTLGCMAMFLATGKLCYILVEPALDAEIAGHFRHTETDGLLIHAKALKTKCQFMPYLVRDDLVVRILHNIADPG